MPAVDGFPIDLEGHTAPINLATGEVIVPPDPEAAAIWAKVERVPPPVAIAMK